MDKLQNIKELEGKQILYGQPQSFLNKGKAKPCYVIVTKFRIFVITEKVFGRKHLRLNQPICYLALLKTTNEENKLHLEIVFREQKGSIVLVFEQQSDALSLVKTLLSKIGVVKEVASGFAPIIELNGIFTEPVYKKMKSRNKKTAVYYEMLCDFYDRVFLINIRDKFLVNDSEVFDLRNLIENEETPGTFINLATKDLFLFGKVISEGSQKFKTVRCRNIVMQDLGFSVFIKKMMQYDTLERLEMVNCGISSGASVSSIEASRKTLHPNLKYLDLSNNSRLGDSGIEAISKNIEYTSLESLRLSNCGVTNKGMHFLAPVILSKNVIESLRNLDISHNLIKSSGAETLAQSLARCKKIESLNVNKTDISVEHIVRALVENRHGVAENSLVSLHMASCKIDAAGTKAICDLLRVTKRLEWLDLSGCHLNGNSFKSMLAALTENPNSKELRLNLVLHNNNFEDCPEDFLKGRCYAVWKLDLSSTFTKASHLISMLNRLEDLPGLVSLKINGNLKLSRFSSGPSELSKSLINLCHSVPTLSNLEISGEQQIYCCKDALNKFFVYLKDNRTLVRLDVSSNKLTDKEIELVANVIRVNPFLKVLNIDYNNSTVHGMLALLDAIKISESMIGGLPFADLESLLVTRNPDSLLRLKLCIDEIENRFESNIKKNFTKIDCRPGTNYAEYFKNEIIEGREKKTEKEKQLIRGKQFGMPLEDLMGTIRIEGIPSRIPVILTLMESYFFGREGHLHQGIFRLAPDRAESDIIRSNLDLGIFEGCKSIHSLSNCIKVWFRLLPVRILDKNIIERIKKLQQSEFQKRKNSTQQPPKLKSAEVRSPCVETEFSADSITPGFDRGIVSKTLTPIFEIAKDGIGESKMENQGPNSKPESYVELVMRDIPEPYSSVLLWLLRFCAQVAAHEEQNKMGPKNLAIVFAPNLTNIEHDDNSDTAYRFLEEAIRWSALRDNKTNL